jgi:hypothetical protein
LIDGFRVYFHSREGTAAPHVHLHKGDANAKLWLQPVRLGFSEGYNSAELRRIRELTFEHQVLFIRRWHEYFGDQR